MRRLLCRLTAHRWTGPICLQLPSHRVVSRYCMRCDATTHIVQDVWSEPLRALLTSPPPPTWADDVRTHARVRETDGAA